MYIYVSDVYYLKFKHVVFIIYHVADDSTLHSRYLYINIHSRSEEKSFNYISVILKSLNSIHPIWETHTAVPNLAS